MELLCTWEMSFNRIINLYIQHFIISWLGNIQWCEQYFKEQTQDMSVQPLCSHRTIGPSK